MNDTPPPKPARETRIAPWFVRVFHARPAESFGQQFAEVARRTLWVLGLEFVLGGFLFAFGVGVGNAGKDELSDLVDHGWLHSMALGAVLLPVVEEFVFRWLPSWLSDAFAGRSDRPRWALGLPLVLLFAAMHNLRVNDAAPAAGWALGAGLSFDTSTWPLPQFTFGLLAWDLVRRYGPWASGFAHVLHNAVVLSLHFVANPSMP